MSLPNTNNPADPTGSDSPAQGDDQLRGIKQYLVDVLGVPNNVAVTAQAASISAAGVMSILQTPFTVPSLVRGTASQVLWLESQYSTLNLRVNNTDILTVNQTGVLFQQPYAEWPAGLTGVLGTKGGQPMIFRSSGLDRWQINPSGMLQPVFSTIDLGTPAGPNPRNVYMASNLFVGGQIQTGPAQKAITTPTGLLDLTKLAVTGEIRGDLAVRQASGWDRFAAGPSGLVLQSQGSGADPQWVYLTGASGFLSNQSLGVGQIMAVFDGASAVLLPGVRLDLPMALNCTIQEATIVGFPTGNLSVDIFRSSYANFPAAIASSIIGGGLKPGFSNAIKSTDTSLATWRSVTVNNGDILRFNIDSCASTVLATLSLKIRKD